MRIRFDLYSGYSEDDKYTEKDSFVQEDGETTEELLQRLVEMAEANAAQLTNDYEGEDED